MVQLVVLSNESVVMSLFLMIGGMSLRATLTLSTLSVLVHAFSMLGMLAPPPVMTIPPSSLSA